MQAKSYEQFECHAIEQNFENLSTQVKLPRKTGVCGAEVDVISFFYCCCAVS